MATVVVFKDETTFYADRVLGVYSANDPNDDKLYFVAQVNGTMRRLDHELVANVYQLAPPDEPEVVAPEVAASVRQLELWPVRRGLLLRDVPMPAGPFAPLLPDARDPDPRDP
jgi:hypothetical protein